MIPTRFNPMGWQPYRRRLSYLESTGTQYINTGCKPDFADGDKIEIHSYNPSYTEGAYSIFGSRDTQNGTIVNGVYQTGSSIVFCDNEGYSGVSWNYRNEHVLSIDDSSIVDNGSTHSIPPRHVTTARDMYLFAINNVGNILGLYSGMKLYDWKYWRNGVLAQHLIPVLDKSGVPCMYDRCTRSFKYNQGTGTFNYA